MYKKRRVFAKEHTAYGKISTEFVAIGWRDLRKPAVNGMRTGFVLSLTVDRLVRTVAVFKTSVLKDRQSIVKLLDQSLERR